MSGGAGRKVPDEKRKTEEVCSVFQQKGELELRLGNIWSTCVPPNTQLQAHPGLVLLDLCTGKEAGKELNMTPTGKICLLRPLPASGS